MGSCVEISPFFELEASFLTELITFGPFDYLTKSVRKGGQSDELAGGK